MTTDPPLKNDQWVLLYTTATSGGHNAQCTWYRVVNVGYDTANNSPTPIWSGQIGTATAPPP